MLDMYDMSGYVAIEYVAIEYDHVAMKWFIDFGFILKAHDNDPTKSHVPVKLLSHDLDSLKYSSAM